MAQASGTTKFSTIWNMSFGFLGIQFGWGLQMANMSAIYEYLGAKPDQIPILWLAAPPVVLFPNDSLGSSNQASSLAGSSLLARPLASVIFFRRRRTSAVRASLP